MSTLQTIVEGYYSQPGRSCPNLTETENAIRQAAEELCPGNVSGLMLALVVYCAYHGIDPVGVMLDQMRAAGYEPPVTVIPHV